MHSFLAWNHYEQKYKKTWLNARKLARKSIHAIATPTSTIVWNRIHSVACSLTRSQITVENFDWMLAEDVKKQHSKPVVVTLSMNIDENKSVLTICTIGWQHWCIYIAISSSFFFILFNCLNTKHKSILNVTIIITITIFMLRHFKIDPCIRAK